MKENARAHHRPGALLDLRSGRASWRRCRPTSGLNGEKAAVMWPSGENDFRAKGMVSRKLRAGLPLDDRRGRASVSFRRCWRQLVIQNAERPDPLNAGKWAGNRSRVWLSSSTNTPGWGQHRALLHHIYGARRLARPWSVFPASNRK